VVGPDGKRYPTWHPAVDPVTGCTFGHEHGHDPRGSRLYAHVGPIPFGVANEALDVWDPSAARHEDHVGHKIEWANDVPVFVATPAGGTTTVRCDFLTKVHQGTHSRDAFTNNLHELVYHVACSDGLELHATLLAAFGQPGEFVRSCDRVVAVPAGAPTPANSPAGVGARYIPDARCADRMLVAEGRTSNDSAATYEVWTGQQRLVTERGRTLATFAQAFAVFGPSRFFSPDAANQLGRTVDLCYLTTADGRRARGDACEATAQAASPLSYDDPRSPFAGTLRKVYLRRTELANANGPTTWYTDPFGGHARGTPFQGSIAQSISAATAALGTGAFDYGMITVIGGDYHARGVHAPN
jgi:hypothetical protein